MSGGFDLRMTGVEDLEKLGRDLKEAGDKGLRKELLKAGRAMGKPIKAEIKESALATLPRRGGLAASIARARVRVSTRLSGKNVGVSFIGKWSGHDLRAVDDGVIRHPVLGHMNEWVTQRIAPGYWAGVFDGPAPKVAHEEFTKAVDEVARKLRAGG